MKAMAFLIFLLSLNAWTAEEVTIPENLEQIQFVDFGDTDEVVESTDQGATKGPPELEDVVVPVEDKDKPQVTTILKPIVPEPIKPIIPVEEEEDNTELTLEEIQKDMAAPIIKLPNLTEIHKQEIAHELEKEAKSKKHDSQTSQFLKKVSGIFKTTPSKNTSSLTKTEKFKNFFKKVGMGIGKGSAWLATTTAKPFMTASGFMSGLFEDQNKNQDIVQLYQFVLNHQSEFDNIYLRVGTPEEMIEAMLKQMEIIFERKFHIIMKDFIKHLGIKKEIPKDLRTFELTPEEIAQIDYSKLKVEFVNNHPEYKEVRSLLGDMQQQDIVDIVSSGYFGRSISFDNYGELPPRAYEMISTVAGQLLAPTIALGIISKTIAAIYIFPVVLSDIGTGVSAAICLNKENQAKFKDDQDLRSFCSYVTNRTSYQLGKSRAKGYVAGKKLRTKINEKWGGKSESNRQKQLQKNANGPA